MKVYLQYPWKFPDSPYYKYLVENPPKGVEYLNTEKQKGVITNKKFFWFSNFLKRNIRRATNLLNAPISNSHKTKPSESFDLIHCAHCLSKNNSPWVADFESEWQFYVGNRNSKLINRTRKILMSENCKKILPWTQDSAKQILEQYPEIKEKIEVVYPAVPLQENLKKRNHKKLTLLFVGRYFYLKGGLHALIAMDKLTNKYKHLEAIMISNVPQAIKDQYRNNKRLKILDLIPQNKLFDVYKNSDIFLYPGYSDSFGFAFLEAMSFGLPIITVSGFSREELVAEGKTGFVVSRPNNFQEAEMRDPNSNIINSLIEKTSILIEDKKLREGLAKNCINEIKKGKFSIATRNKKLKKIYMDATK